MPFFFIEFDKISYSSQHNIIIIHVYVMHYAALFLIYENDRIQNQNGRQENLL